jgi:dTMP kinase
MPARSPFITLEGIDGAGKSTHVAFIAQCIAQRGATVVTTREPGGTPLGEALREVLLHRAMSRDTETLLMFAARREHVEQVIRPALARREWVLCDRFTDATYAYQGGGHGVAMERIAELADWIHGDCEPDRTFLFDVPPAVSRARLAAARASGRDPDRFEREEEAFFERVRAVYLERARAEPRRFRVIDSSASLGDVQRALSRHVEELATEFAQ